MEVVHSDQLLSLADRSLRHFVQALAHDLQEQFTHDWPLHAEAVLLMPRINILVAHHFVVLAR